MRAGVDQPSRKCRGTKEEEGRIIKGPEAGPCYNDKEVMVMARFPCEPHTPGSE